MKSSVLAVTNVKSWTAAMAAIWPSVNEGALPSSDSRARSAACQAAAYLDAALEEDDQEVFLLALRDVAEARGLGAVAQEAKLNRENLYRMLSREGNPQLTSLNALLRSLGLRLAVEVEHS